MDFILLLFNLFIFAFGLCAGSFLNCVIYRLEKKKKMTARSFCPKCKKQLRWQDLIPVFSFLFLKGKCRYCRKKISWQYPLVELATGILFVLIFWFCVTPGVTQLSFLLFISCFLIVIFVYDLKHYIIPDKVLFPAILLALIFNFSISAALIASGFFLIIFLVSRGKWMGFGDVKLAILIGLLLGLPDIFVALFLAFFFGAIIGLILMVLPARAGGKKKNLKSEVPFAPFLITGTFIAMLWGSQIIQWYLNFFKI